MTLHNLVEHVKAGNVLIGGGSEESMHPIEHDG